MALTFAGTMPGGVGDATGLGVTGVGGRWLELFSGFDSLGQIHFSSFGVLLRGMRGRLGVQVDYGVASILVFLTGLVFILGALLLRGQEVLFAVLLSVGGAVLAANVVSLLSRLIPTGAERVKFVKGHKEIYDEFHSMLKSLDPERVHTIRTINSFVAETEIETEWDNFVTTFLRNNKSSQFIRVLAYRETSEWEARIARLKERYAGVTNYHQVNWKRPSLPTVEMLLVNTDDVLLSFATEDVPNPQVNAGIRMKEKQVCEQLEAFHRLQLEDRLPTESLSQTTLPDT